MRVASNGRRNVLPLALIVAAIAVVHHAVYTIPFMYSEIAGIQRNRVVTDPAAFAERMVTPKGLLQRPLSVLSYMVDHAVWGGAVAGFHLTNVAIHCLNTALVYLLARDRFAAPVVAALVFGLHPLATACVSQVFGRNYSLATTFFLLALYAYLRWRSSMTVPRIAAVTMLVLAAILTKQTFVAAPLVLAWYEIAAADLPIRVALDRLGASWWVVIGAAGATLVGVTLLVRYAIPLSQTATIPLGTFALSQIGNAPVVAGFYVLPYRTALIHDLYLYRDVGHVEVWLGAVLVVGSALAAYRWRATPAGWLLGALLLSLLPTNSVVPKNDLVREWRLYPALPFFALLVAIGCARAASSAGPAWRRMVVATAVGVYVATFAWADVRQNQAYQSQLSAWEQVLARYPYSTDAMNNIGMQLYKRGDYERALDYFTRAADAAPDVSLYRHNAAQAHAALGHRDDAEREALAARTLQARFGARSMALHYR
jgi:protein O-mannosyl-transferase